MKRIFWRLYGAFLLILCAGPTHAQDIPTYPTLPCEGTCPQFTPAKATSRPRVDFTTEQVAAGEEAAVSVSFTVGVDGRTKNVVIEEVVGSSSFVDNTKQQVLAATFEPGTENGKPIEENKWSRYIYRMSPSPQHPAVIQAYRDALSHETPADKIAALREIQHRTALSLYETTMIASETARLEAQAGDDRDALRDIEIATLENGDFLSKEEAERALRLQIILEARAEQYGAAFVAFDVLKKLKDVTVTENDPEAQLISQLHAEIASSKPLWASAEIPDSADSQNTARWHHTMLRRSFGFANIKGSLTSFTLRCEAHGMDSTVSESATWTIPAAWSKCNIFVEGTLGTTFKFGEAQPNAASMQNKPTAN